MLHKKNEGILFSAEIRVVGSYTDRLLILIVNSFYIVLLFIQNISPFLIG